jgi:tripartite-type tricarboxylate transporter receptor subunit TctC
MKRFKVTLQSDLSAVRRKGFKYLVVAALAATTPSLLAQSWPARPLRLVIPYAAGGPTDILGRAIAPALSEVLGQPIAIENRAGSGAIVGMNTVAKSQPDGYTILLGDINLAVNPALYRSLPYDISEFAPVSLLASAPLVLAVSAGSNYRSLNDLIAAARERPGRLSFGSAGAGNTTHLASELLKETRSLDIVHVPYKGAGPALNDLAAGQTDFVITGLSGARALIDAGKIRALAITGQARAVTLPDVPTFAEAGTPLPDMNLGSWWGLFVPAATPESVISTLQQATVRALDQPELRRQLTARNIQPMHSSPSELGRFVASESSRWTQVLRRARIEPQ